MPRSGGGGDVLVHLQLDTVLGQVKGLYPDTELSGFVDLDGGAPP